MEFDKDKIATWIYQDPKIRGPLYVKVVESVMRKCIDECIRLDHYVYEEYITIRMFGDILDRELMSIVNPKRRGPMLYYLVNDNLHSLSDTYVRYNNDLTKPFVPYYDVMELIYNYDYVISEITSIQRENKLTTILPPDSMSSHSDDFKENPEDKNPREYSDTPIPSHILDNSNHSNNPLTNIQTN